MRAGGERFAGFATTMAPPVEGDRRNLDNSGYSGWTNTNGVSQRPSVGKFNGTGRIEISAGMPIGSQACTPPRPFKSPFVHDGVPKFSLDTTTMSAQSSKVWDPLARARCLSELVDRVAPRLHQIYDLQCDHVRRFHRRCRRRSTHAR